MLALELDELALEDVLLELDKLDEELEFDEELVELEKELELFEDDEIIDEVLLHSHVVIFKSESTGQTF